MAMHAFIIGLFVLHGQATLLESGDDDYYEDPNGKPIDVQVKNAIREDKLSLDIYNKLVSGKSGASCSSLKTWVSAYASDTTLWTADDKDNPEYKERPPNELLGKLRANINKIVKKPDVKCHEIWHLVLCPFTGVRFLAPYEFVFKKPGQAWSNTAGIVDTLATKAYNTVKCGNANSQCTKHGATPVQLFLNAKGRETDKTLKPPMDKNRFIGGNAGSPVMNGGKVVENIADLKDFWKHAEQQEVFGEEQVKQFTAAEQKIVFAEVGHGPPPQGHMPARDNSDGYKTSVKSFEDCGVPWIGGISGSVLEMFAYAKYKGTEMNDVFALQWMSLYVLAGFHSLGEIWSALKPMLKEFGDLDKMKLKDVSVPFDLQKGCVGGKPGEAKFLDELEKVFKAVSR